MSFYYLATPYTYFPYGIDVAWKVACAENARLIKAGIPTYSPIAHTHAVAMNSDLDPLDWQFWMDFDHNMMEAAKGLIVLMAEGFERSKGMAEEINTFSATRKPIIWMKPGEVPAQLL